MKVCTICGNCLPISEYYARKDTGNLRSECKVCTRARNRGWAEANKEKMDAYKKHYSNKPSSKEKLKAKSQTQEAKEASRRRNHKYVEVNREAVYARNKAWLDANKHKRVEYKLARRCAEEARSVVWDKEFTDFVTAEAADLCKRRKAATGVDWEIDHVVPLKGERVSGLHVWNNLQVITRADNRRKSNSFDIF